jgi:hypothetical protein
MYIHSCTFINTYILIYIRMYICMYVYTYVYTYVGKLEPAEVPGGPADHQLRLTTVAQQVIIYIYTFIRMYIRMYVLMK